MNSVIKEILISILGYSILNIRTASNEKNLEWIFCELEHLKKMLALLMDMSLLNDYMNYVKIKYLEQTSECHQNSYEDLWNELQNIVDKQVTIDVKLDELDEVLIGIVNTAVNNLSYYADNKDYKNSYIEAYHVHNIPSIIISKKKEEMIKYYFKVERKQYLREGKKEARKKFEDKWKELKEITKLKKKIFPF